MRRIACGRRRLAVAMLALGSGFAAAGLAQGQPSGSDAAIRKGGTLRVGQAVDAIDPAGPDVYVYDAVCAPLLNFRDKPQPAGLRVVPDAAAGLPRISRSGRTFTFIVRRGFRFSSGRRLTARNFEYALNRLLDPVFDGYLAPAYDSVVGAKDVRAGRARRASGIQARGNRVVIRLSEPDPLFPVKISGLCPVELNRPADAEGIGAPFSGAGPYYVASWERGGGAVLKRNRFYGGRRPHHVDELRWIPTDPTELVGKIQSGAIDWGVIPTAAIDAAAPTLVRRYGLNRSRFFSLPDLNIWYVAMNTTSRLFKNNARLRRAVNFALDRRRLRSLAGAYAGPSTDQYLPTRMPGFQNEHIYPLNGPDLRRARRLARGRTRGGKAILYGLGSARATSFAQAIRGDLRKIGLDVELKLFPRPVLFEKLYAGEPYDMALVIWIADWPDPANFLNVLLRGGSRENLAHFNVPRYNKRLDAASELSGRARYRAYGRLDVELARTQAPLAVFLNQSVKHFFSRRVGCLNLRPNPDLTAVCLRR